MKKKTEGMWLGNKRMSNDNPLPIIWTNKVKVLGIVFSYDEKLATSLNFDDKVMSLKQTLALWKSPGGALNTMRCAMCHQKDPHFLSPLSPNDPMVYALSPIDPYLLSLKDPQFLILSPKTHHFNYLAQTLIRHNN